MVVVALGSWTRCAHWVSELYSQRVLSYTRDTADSISRILKKRNISTKSDLTKHSLMIQNSIFPPACLPNTIHFLSRLKLRKILIILTAILVKQISKKWIQPSNYSWKLLITESLIGYFIFWVPLNLYLLLWDSSSLKVLLFSSFKIHWWCLKRLSELKCLENSEFVFS